MADVSHSSIGYTGTVDQIAEARRFAGTMGSPFVASNAGAWQVTAFASSNRTVQIAAGAGLCCGVRDATSANATLTVAANSSGSTRYDVVVATYNWAAGTPATSFNVITGTSAGIPTINNGASVVAGQINRIAGVQYDAVLAVIQVPNAAGVLSSANVMDRRPYAAGGGARTVAGSTFLTALDMGAGGEIIAADSNTHWYFDGTTWTRYPVNNKTFSTLAARDSYFSGSMVPVNGDRCVCLGAQMTHDGTKWRFVLSGVWTGGTDANGFFAIPHGGGQAPFGWVITPGYQVGDATNFAVHTLSSSNAGDATMLGGRAMQNNTYYGAAFSITVTWMAQF